MFFFLVHVAVLSKHVRFSLEVSYNVSPPVRGVRQNRTLERTPSEEMLEDLVSNMNRIRADITFDASVGQHPSDHRLSHRHSHRGGAARDDGSLGAAGNVFTVQVGGCSWLGSAGCPVCVACTDAVRELSPPPRN